MKILIVEDMPERTCVFFQWFKDHDVVVCNSAKESSEIIKTMRFDLIFLDHDLGLRAYVDSNDPNTGMQIVKCVEFSPNARSRFIIHSWNTIGVENMRSYLSQSCPEAKVEVVMFGQFDQNILYN